MKTTLPTTRCQNFNLWREYISEQRKKATHKVAQIMFDKLTENIREI